MPSQFVGPGSALEIPGTAGKRITLLKLYHTCYEADLQDGPTSMTIDSNFYRLAIGVNWKDVKLPVGKGVSFSVGLNSTLYVEWEVTN